VAECHGGHVPDDPQALRALPGIGRYTAGAIASVAFGHEQPVVDGNVRRVLARMTARRDARTAQDDAAWWQLGERLVRGPAPGDFNQALMELGATVCLPQQPRCEACPWQADCRAHGQGRAERFPGKIPKPAPEIIDVAVAWVEHGGRLLLVPRQPPAAQRRAPGASPLRGEWDVPAIVCTADAGATALARTLRNHSAVALRPASELGKLTHSILHRRLRIRAYRFVARSGAAASGARFVELARLDDVPVSSVTRKVLALARSAALQKAAPAHERSDGDARSRPKPSSASSASDSSGKRSGRDGRPSINGTTRKPRSTPPHQTRKAVVSTPIRSSRPVKARKTRPAAVADAGG
jgi:A/G-specific adenine glycosylase